MELVPQDMLADLGKAKIVITNYHAFRKRELLELAKGTRQLLQGRGEELHTKETEGQMIQRVMPELMGLKRVLVLNDEAHHCYREKPLSDDEAAVKLDSEDKAEAKKNREAARLWISGLEAVNRKIGINRVIDLSATPFFLSSSGYVEGTLFPWTSSDFSLMDAIECGIVKLPRVPVADNVAAEMPRFRKLWENIKGKMPKKGRGSGGTLDPENLPTELKTALKALYGHYEQTYKKWQEAGIEVPPCFITVCNNTATSKLVYDWVSGYERRDAQGDQGFRKGDLPLFWNHDEHGSPLPRPRTLLIDSEQLESGDALDKDFREMAAQEIEQFRRERVEREGAGAATDKITDSELLREVMNTVGKPGRLGQDIRCVVSVAMLSEGWDANTVTHVLGVRAFGTQLLCEQVVGRALRRWSYELNTEKVPPRFDVEYADIFGIPFDFTAQAVVSPPQPPPPMIRVHAVSPERDAAEITFPSVLGFRVELPDEVARAEFHKDHHLVLSPDLVGPGQTSNQGIIGEEAQLDLEHTKTIRRSTVIMNLAKHLVYTKYRDAGEAPKLHLILPMKKIVRQWLDQCLECKGGMTEGLLLWKEIADMACNRIVSAIMLSAGDDKKILAMIDPYNPTGSSRAVNFTTSKTLRWQCDSRKSHVNWAICDSTWEQEFCRVLESQPQVVSYVKNQGLGFEVPYNYMSTVRRYIPDFITRIDDGHGKDDLLNLVCEVKGFRGEDAKDKRNTMETFWVPGVNNTGKFGRWAFAEFKDVFKMQDDFAEQVDDAAVAGVINTVINRKVG
jgi:type III restriction enzyme